MQEKSNAPELSIIVPVYRVEKHLDECIQSILHQTFTDFELILVDDGSPDACPQMCDAAAEQDSRVQVIHQKNGGLSSARNAGIEAARGNWLGFIDSDDFVAPDFYEKLYGAATSANADCAVCSIQLTNEDGSPMETPPQWKAYGGWYTGEDILKTLTWQNNASYLVAWNKLYRREVFADLRYPVGHLNEDSYVFAQLFDTVKTVVCVEQPLYFYRQRPGSIMKSMDALRSLDEMWSFANCFDYFAAHGYAELLCAAEKRAFAKLLRVYCQLTPEQRRGLEIKRARKKQRAMAAELCRKRKLNIWVLQHTVIFQLCPVLYRLREKWRKHGTAMQNTGTKHHRSGVQGGKVSG